MIFLADIYIEGSPVREIKKTKIEKSSTKKARKKNNNKNKVTKQENSTFTKLVNKTTGLAGVLKFTEGEMSIIKSMAKNDVKTPLKSSKGKQKTIGVKKNPSFYRKEK